MPPARRNALAIPLGEDGIPTTVSNLCGSASPCEETNPVSTNPFAYDAWGNVLSEVCTVPALATIRYRFQGREWSAATGLINFRMRWYDPETGRWLSKDPIGLSGGLNLYAFCGNDSINRVDHCGNISALVGFIGGAAIGGFSGFITGGGLVGTLAGALGGGIGGLVTVLTGNPTLGGAVSGFITSTLSEISKGDKKNWGSVAVNTLWGAGFGFLAEPIGEIDQLLGDIYTGVVPGVVSAICYLPEKFSKSRCD